MIKKYKRLNVSFIQLFLRSSGNCSEIECEFFYSYPNGFGKAGGFFF